LILIVRRSCQRGCLPVLPLASRSTLKAVVDRAHNRFSHTVAVCACSSLPESDQRVIIKLCVPLKESLFSKGGVCLIHCL